MNSRKTYWPVGLAGVLLALSFPAAAHHGQAGLFDDTRTIELEGTVKEWSFVNPHPVLVLETTEALRRRGFSAETFAAGETLVITGHPATAAGVHGIDVWGGDSSVKRGDGSGVP
jgi:hypothetical protein